MGLDRQVSSQVQYIFIVTGAPRSPQGCPRAWSQCLGSSGRAHGFSFPNGDVDVKHDRLPAAAADSLRPLSVCIRYKQLIRDRKRIGDDHLLLLLDDSAAGLMNLTRRRGCNLDAAGSMLARVEQQCVHSAIHSRVVKPCDSLALMHIITVPALAYPHSMHTV